MSNFLTPDRTITIGGVTVNRKIVPASFAAPKDMTSWIKKGQNIKPCRKLNDGTGKPRGICIHNTEAIQVPAGTTMAEQYTRATYSGNMAGVIVTYYVDDKCAWQLLDEDEQGWHAADGTSRKATARPFKTIGGNLDCISFEIIGDSAKANDNAARIAAYLLNKYNLAVDDMYGHIFFSGKNCPMFILKNNGWDKFKNLVRGYVSNSFAPAQPSAPAVPAQAPPKAPSPKKSVDEAAREIIRGTGGWGNNPERRERLIAA